MLSKILKETQSRYAMLVLIPLGKLIIERYIDCLHTILVFYYEDQVFVERACASSYRRISFIRVSDVDVDFGVELLGDVDDVANNESHELEFFNGPILVAARSASALNLQLRQHLLLFKRLLAYVV